MVFSFDLRFIVCFGGIFFSYLIYGILQEDVYVHIVIITIIEQRSAFKLVNNNF